MNGFSLLLAFASLGVVYSWRTGADQQQEYVLQIEPEIVQALAAGEEIFSDVPPDLGPFQRLCITILPKDGNPIRHTAAGEEQFRQLLLSAGRYASRDRTLVAPDSQPTILWPNRGGATPEQTYGVTTGWQPDASGKQQYFVQIDPTVLSTLAIGDELYVPIDPAAGRLARFVVKTGRENLQRIGGPQATNPQAQIAQGPPTSTRAGRGRYPAFTDTAAPATDPRGTQFTSPPGTLASNLGFQAPQTSYGNAASTIPPTSAYPSYNPVSAGGSSNLDQYRVPPTSGTDFVAPPGYSPQPVASQQPQLPTGPRQFNPQYSETRTAALPPTPVSTAASAPLNPGVLSPSAVVQTQQDKPWGPLLFVTFALFFSIGGNLYLAYTALEFHSRYRNAIERLRSAARSA